VTVSMRSLVSLLVTLGARKAKTVVFRRLPI
jgi:hypothetical protein